MTVYILDSSAFIYRNIPEDESLITVPRVEEELVDPRSRLELDLALGRGLRIESPQEDCRCKVIEEASRTGDAAGLSNTDIDLLSKALEYREAVIVTDDYAVQNVAARLEIKTIGISQPGITRVLEWGWRCSACGRRYEAGGTCTVCGSNIKRYRRKRG